MSDQPPKPFQFSLRKLLMVVGALCVVLALLSLVVQAAREEARLHGRLHYCLNNLKQIGISLHNYHDEYDCFPPAFSIDANGKPLHSWRVALEEDRDFQATFDHGLPWNDPKNLAASAPFSHHFICPSAEQPPGSGFTNYVMVVGPQGSTNPNAIIVVEIADSDIHWTEPHDLNFGEMSFKINDKSKPSISSHHLHGAMVLHADGSVHFLDESTDPETVRKLLTENLEDASGWGRQP